MASPSRGGGGGEAQPTGKKAKGKKNKGKGGGGGGGSGGGGAGGKRKAAEESSDDEDDGPAPKVKRRKLADASAKWKVMQLEPFKGNFVRADLGCPFCGEYPGTCDPFNCTADSAPPSPAGQGEEVRPAVQVLHQDQGAVPGVYEEPVGQRPLSAGRGGCTIACIPGI